MNSNDAVEPDGVDTPFDVFLRGWLSLQTVKASVAATEAVLLASIPDLVVPETVHGTDADMFIRSALAELGVASHQSDRSLWSQLNNAYILVRDFPATLRALQDGRISAAHVREIQHAGQCLEPEARAEFEAAALERAECETPGRLKSWLASLAEPLKPKSINERHQEARACRGIRVIDLDDGMSEIRAILPSALARGIQDRLTQIAHDVKRNPRAGDGTGNGSGECVGDADAHDGLGLADAPESLVELDSFGLPTHRTTTGDAAELELDEPCGPSETHEPHEPRTIDQIRAEVFADLLLAGMTCAHGDGYDAIQAHVQVVVPVLNLAGLTSDGADLVGTGPIDAETARRLAGAATGWDRVMTHPITGQVLATDRYQPTADQRRALRVRDEHCRFPGCLQKPWQTDIDHSTAFSEGGRTELDNLEHLCRRHHTMKHARGWIITHLGDGLIQWTSPHGLIYVDTPPPKLRFVPSTAAGRFAEYGPDWSDPGDTSDAPF